MALVKVSRLEQLQRLEQLEQLQRLEQLEQLQQLEQLEQLQRLEQLEQLQRLEHKSYDEVEIKPGAVIYCDPPYAKTAGYKNAGDFDHVKFWSWAREKSKTNPVFVSEYNAPSDVRCIYEFSRRQLLSKGKTCNNERVFYLNNMEEKK